MIRPRLLAQISHSFRVPVDDVLGIKVKASRKTGPDGRVRRVFEAVSRLPRRQQQKIIEAVEALVAQDSGA